MIIPICCPRIDWEAFVTYSNEFLGRSPTRQLDYSQIPVGNYSSFLASIGGFLDQNSNPHSFVRTNESALEHLYYTFLCNTSVLPLVRVYTDHTILASTESVFLLSGTLRQYKRSIVECSRESIDPSLRFFFNCLYIYFKKQGLEVVWSAYSKRILFDGTVEFNL